MATGKLEPIYDPGDLGPFGQPYLVIRLSTQPSEPPGWLCRAPCPVIGIGHSDRTDPFAAACDTIVPDEAAAAPLLRAIARAPIAATTLVQVLRATRALPLHQALTLESFAYATLQNGVENRAWRTTQPQRAPAAAQPGPPLLIERDGPILALTLNRPATHNSIDIELRDALTEALRLATADPDITRINLSAIGRCFSAGGALHEFGTAPDQATAHAVRVVRGPAFALAPVAARVHVLVHGACIGAGAELAALCGHVAAHPRTFFQLPELRMGLIPGSGGTAGFVRRIGRHRTTWLVLSGRRLSARDALAWGLIDEIRAQPI